MLLLGMEMWETAGGEPVYMSVKQVVRHRALESNGRCGPYAIGRHL